jgi:acyl-homoserine-lactone acylase
MSNRVPAAELWLEELVAMCKQLPFVPSQSGPVSTAGACEALEGFNKKDDLDSKGAVLFRRFAVKALAANASPYDVAFSAADPVNTPRGLNTENPQVRLALGDAINDLKAAGIPLDAPLRGFQYEKRGEEQIPVHGGPGTTGVYNVITAGWNPKGGHPDVNHGSSFVQAVELTGACPKVRTILTYSQSTNPASPHYADQNRLYAKKGWNEPPFCGDSVARAALRTLQLSGTRTGQLRSVRASLRRRSSRVRVRFALVTGGDVRVTLTRSGKRVRAITKRGLRKGSHSVTLIARRKGTYRVTVTHRGETRRLTVRRR